MQSTFLGEGYKQPKFLIDKPQKENKINFFVLISIFYVTVIFYLIFVPSGILKLPTGF